MFIDQQPHDIGMIKFDADWAHTLVPRPLPDEIMETLDSGEYPLLLQPDPDAAFYMFGLSRVWDGEPFMTTVNVY